MESCTARDITGGFTLDKVFFSCCRGVKKMRPGIHEPAYISIWHIPPKGFHHLSVFNPILSNPSCTCIRLPFAYPPAI